MIALPPVRELPWLKPSRIPTDAKVITDPQQALIAGNADEAVSDTGELTSNWRQGTYTIDTPRTQAAMGWLGGKTISLSDVEIDVTTRNATVAVQSLDNNPFSTANDLMISLRALNPKRKQYDVSVRTGRRPPHDPSQTRAEVLQARRRYSNGNQIPAAYANGRYRIELEPDLGTYWLFMK